MRALAKNPAPLLILNNSEETSCVEDPQEKRKIQKLRNRVSAQMSRDRKKEYLQRLEAHNTKLASENTALRKENIQLKKTNEALRTQIEELQRGPQHNFGNIQGNTLQRGPLYNEKTMELNFKRDFEVESESHPQFVMRRNNNRSGHVVKYSLALVAMFAVIMYSNIGMQTGYMDIRKPPESRAPTRGTPGILSGEAIFTNNDRTKSFRIAKTVDGRKKSEGARTTTTAS